MLGLAEYERLRPHVERALAGNETSFEDWIPRAGGAPRYLVTTLVPHAADDGRVAGFVSVSSDETERKTSEDRLQQQLEQLRHLYRLSDGMSRAAALDEVCREALDGLR